MGLHTFEMQKEVSKMRASFSGLRGMSAADIFKDEIRRTESTSEDE